MLFLKRFLIFMFFSPCFLLGGTIHVPKEAPTIQDGINAAFEGDTVLVSQGVYYENVNFLGKSITVSSYYLLSQNPQDIENTVIDGEYLVGNSCSSVVTFVTGEDTTSRLIGFTIRNGQGTLLGEGIRGGGGIYCNNSTPLLKDNIIINNIADKGGGIYAQHPGYKTIKVLGNTIKNNYALNFGGGICLDLGSAVISENVIKSNAALYGGGISSQWGWSNEFEIEHNKIVRNVATHGGGFWMDKAGTRITFKNNLIGDNTGNGIDIEDYAPASVVFVLNNTIIGNEVGIFCMLDSIFITNNIISNNNQGISIFGANYYEITYNDVWNNPGGDFINCEPGIGNISEDPLFVSGPHGDFYLSQFAAGQPEESPCVDEGSTSAQELGLDVFTTRTDQVPDQGLVDIGYHYSIFIPGDANGDGFVNTNDLVYIANFLFQSGPPPDPFLAGDTNGDCTVTIADIIYLANYLFMGGPPPIECGI